MEAMVIVVPLVVLLLVFGLASGSTNFIVLLPILIFGGAGAFFISIAIRDGRPPVNRSVRRLPTGHLQRQMYLALRPRRPGRKPSGKADGDQDKGSSGS